MEFLPDEGEEYGKCRKHPSLIPTGICPICLKNRLILLCPDCANVRPCGCLHPSMDIPTSSSSSSSSSSFSYTDFCKSGASVGAVGRMSFLIESEPAFRRSRSAAFHFIRTKSEKKSAGDQPPLPETWSRSSSSSFWSFFKKKKKTEEEKRPMTTTKMMQRSRSVGSACYSNRKEISGDIRLKVWGWHFPSPIKAFRYPKSVKVVHERSPMCRG